MGLQGVMCINLVVHGTEKVESHCYCVQHQDTLFRKLSETPFSLMKNESY